MTRINAGIPPSELCDQHLLSEYRELPRVRSLALKTTSEIPERFRLGKGHMLFFVNKGGWLRARWLDLRAELRERGFWPELEWRPWPEHLDGAWEPTDDELSEVIDMVRARICERLAGAKRTPTWTRRSKPSWIG